MDKIEVSFIDRVCQVLEKQLQWLAFENMKPIVVLIIIHIALFRGFSNF